MHNFLPKLIFLFFPKTPGQYAIDNLLFEDFLQYLKRKL